MTRSELLATIEEALIYDVFDESDTDAIVESIFHGVVEVLRHNARFPRLTRTAYELLFADLAQEARETLRPYWRVNTKHAAEVIADAVIDAVPDEVDVEDDSDEHREDTKADQTAVVAE
jgi:hypothetical protein